MLCHVAVFGDTDAQPPSAPLHRSQHSTGSARNLPFIACRTAAPRYFPVALHVVCFKPGGAARKRRLIATLKNIALLACFPLQVTVRSYAQQTTQRYGGDDCLVGMRVWVYWCDEDHPDGSHGEGWHAAAYPSVCHAPRACGLASKRGCRGRN